MIYDKDKDYMQLMQEAAKNGDLYGAALYEAQRNQKIKDMGLGYETTNSYGNYLYDGNTDYMAKMQDAAKQGDFKSAAHYEALRNQKITGEGINMDMTRQYEPYRTALAGKDKAQAAVDGRGKFSYDPQSNPLYQQYKDMYIRNGRMAMTDTMGKAAAMTGGYGNSYAQTAGQQIYQQYLDQLNDRVPELQQLAYRQYADEEARDLAALDRANAAEQLEYNRLLSARDDAYDRERDQRNWDYQLWQDQRNWDYQMDRDQRSEQSDASQRAYQLALTMLSSGIMPSADVLAAAGIGSTDASAIAKAYAQQTGASGTRHAGSSSSSGNKGTSGSTGSTGNGSTERDKSEAPKGTPDGTAAATENANVSERLKGYYATFASKLTDAQQKGSYAYQNAVDEVLRYILLGVQQGFIDAQGKDWLLKQLGIG